MSLDSLKVRSAARELTHLDKALDGLVQHVRFLASRCVADHLVLGTVNDLRADALRAHGRLAEISQTLSAAARRDHTLARVDVASTRGMARKIDERLLELEGELHALSTAVERHINDPGRYGDAAATGLPFLELCSCIQTVLELAKTVLERKARASGR